MECYRKWIVYAMLISLILIGCSDGSSNPVTTASIEGSPTPTPTETPEPEVARTQKIVAFGDSITYGCQVGCGSQPSGYPRMLNAQLQAAGYDVYVDNAGVPGEKSSQTEIRFETAIVGADIVLIMIGTNDIVNPSGCVHPNECQTAAYIGTMVEILLQNGQLPLVSTIPPANPNDIYGGRNPKIRQVNEEIKAMAASLGVTLVDIHATLEAHLGEGIFADRLHFTDRGYEIIANAWFNALVDELESPKTE